MVSRITMQDLSILLIILIIVNILSKSLLYACMHFTPVWLCNPMDYSPPGPSVHGILQARVLEWVAISSSGDLPHPRIEPTSRTSPALVGRFFTTAAAAAKLLQSCLTVRPQRRQPTRLPRPWDSPGKNTEVGCHFLLQCMKVKSESEVAQSCPTPSNPMDCSLPGSSIHEICQARVLSGVPLPSPTEPLGKPKKKINKVKWLKLIWVRMYLCLGKLLDLQLENHIHPSAKIS